jgi:hypothetical protein
MAEPVAELEGIWEEIVARGAEFAGRRVRLTVLPESREAPYPGIAPDERPSTAASLLRYAGTWVGDDLERCLKEVYENRSKAEF